MVKSKKIIIGILISLGIFLIALVLIFQKNQKPEIISPSTGESAGATLPPQKENLKTYDDQAGFSFNYSQTLLAKEVENQDDNTYSWLELADASRLGEKMSIKVTDTSLASVGDWINKNKETDWVVNETVLGGMNGKLIHSSTKIITVAIEKGILFLIDSPVDSAGYWKEQQLIVTESFKVSWPTPKQTSAPAGDSGIEEIIE